MNRRLAYKTKCPGAMALVCEGIERRHIHKWRINRTRASQRGSHYNTRSCEQNGVPFHRASDIRGIVYGAKKHSGNVRSGGGDRINCRDASRRLGHNYQRQRLRHITERISHFTDLVWSLTLW